MEFLLKVDGKGRILIPARVRRELGLGRVVRARIEGGRLVLEPIRDPVEVLAQTVLEGTRDVEEEIGRLRRAAEREGLKRVGERWP